MRNRFLIVFATGVITILSAPWANADKLCLKTTVNKKTLKATTVSALAAKCPSGYTAIADTDFFVGPEGDVGPQGAVGPQGSVGPQGVQGATGPQGAAGAGVSLYDSSDGLVGPVGSVGCQFYAEPDRKPMERVSVLLTIDNRTYSVCASLDEFIATTDVAFASTGCTGQAYLFPYSVPSTTSTLFTAGRVTAAGSQRILYRPDYVTGASTITRRSHYNSDGLCTDSTATETLFPAIQVSNLSTAYPAPLEVR